MNNPYTPPSVVEKSSRQPGFSFWLVAVGTTIFAFGLGFIGSYVVPAFKELFINMHDHNLPTLTSLLIEGRLLLWLPFIATVGIWLFWYKSPSRHKFRARITAAFLLLGAGCACILVGAIWVLYLPLFPFGVAQ